MARLRVRRTKGGSSYPFWVAVLAVAGLSLWSARGRAPGSGTPDAGSPGSAVASTPASAPGSETPPLTPPVLTWRTEGTRDLPTPPELLGCLVRFGGRTPTLTASRVQGQFATDIEYLGPPVKQRLESAAPGEPAGLVARTQVGGRPHAALAAHLALAACIRTGAETLVDVDLGRRYTAAMWPSPLPDGSVNVDALFSLEARSDVLVSRGMARLGLPELAVRPGAGGMEAARARLLRAIAAAIVAERVEERLEIEGVSAPLTALKLPDGLEARLVGGGARRATPGPGPAAAAPSSGAAPSKPPAPASAWRPASLPDYR